MYRTNNALPLPLTLPITQWLKDETLYSLCCRFHYVSGNALASTTARQLFSHPKLGTQHDFASRINVFVQRTQGTFGETAEDIIHGHTILPYYLPWRTRPEALSIVRQLSLGNSGSIKSLLGLPSSRVRANHPLKACPLCMQTDTQQFGVCYWHLTHQLPCVWVCPVHGCRLAMSTKKSTGVGRFLWHLPDANSFYPSPSTTNNGEGNLWLLQLARASLGAFQLAPRIHIDPQKLRSTYRVVLARRGLLRGALQVALSDAAYQYLQFTQKFKCSELDIPLPENDAQAKQQLSRLLGSSSRSAHPIRNLLVILWLFGDWEKFWNLYQTVDPYSAEDTAEHARTSPPSDPRQLRLAELIKNQGLTISAAAKMLNISVQTAQYWACLHGTPIPRRSKISRRVVTSILRELHRGKDSESIAQRYGISAQTVWRLLRTEPGLSEKWREIRQSARTLSKRKVWQRTIEKNPDAILKELRGNQPACYAWLYRNDRAWLTQSIAQIPKSQYISAGNVDWHERDIRLVAKIKAAVYHIERHVRAHVTLQKIYQYEPSLKPYLNKLARLPLTRHLLAEVSQQSSSTQARLFK